MAPDGLPVSKVVLRVEKILEILRESPIRIAEILEGVPAARLQSQPREGGWSAAEVLAHLRACADVWGGCIEVLLTQDRPTIKAVNPKLYLRGVDYPRQRFGPSFDALKMQRAGLLRRLEALTAADWRRSATVTGAGAPLRRTVRDYAQRLARHERTHWKQFKRLAEELRA